MATKLEQLKEWAKQNVTMIDLLPNNSNLQVTTRLIDVLEDEVDEKYYLSEEKTKKLTLDFSLTSQDKHGIAVREATKQGYAIAEQGDSVNVTYPDSKTRRGRVGKQVAQTLQAGEVNQGVVIPKEEYGRFGRQAVETLNENEDIINDGMTVNAYNKTIDKTGLSPTLTTRPEGFKTAILPITNGLRIRKLTEKECWRLQGFTDEQFYKAKNSGVSNSQLYKQSGNAVSVPVVDAIVKCL